MDSNLERGVRTEVQRNISINPGLLFQQPDAEPIELLRKGAKAYFAAGTQTLSGARISEFGSSVSILTRWSPDFFPGVAWNTT